MPRLSCLALTVLIALAACKEEPQAAPSQTYLDYYAKVIAGRSFDEDAAYQSGARRAQVADQIQTRSSGAGQTADQIQTMYLNFTQALAKCGDLTLDEETIDGDTATVIFAVKDTCTGGDGDGRLVIEMVDEDGWKIVSDTLQVGGN